jgi:transposase
LTRIVFVGTLRADKKVPGDAVTPPGQRNPACTPESTETILGYRLLAAREPNVDAREQRGLVIAATAKITQKGRVWLCPSQSGNGKYTVSPDEQQPHCSCPDHEETGCTCKHIYAVRFVIQRELFDDGTEVETRQLTVTETRKTYPQNWRAYNESQVNEGETFQSLLRELCDGITVPPAPTKRGRPRLCLSDALYSAIYKVYSTMSARRCMSDLKEAQAKGHISRVPCYNSIFNVFDSEETTDILKALVVETSKPLTAVETDFAVDSSGFTTSRFHRWFDHKYGKERVEHDWVKVHIMVGVKTNVVTAVEIKDRNSNDSPMLPALLESTRSSFQVKELSADKQYASLDNFNAIEAAGATPYIAFRRGITGRMGGAFTRAFHQFCLYREQFLKNYHKRSNVESTFSSIKRKFGDHVRSKTDRAMVNEALCKIVCHNITVLIHEMSELGINPIFWAEKPVAQKVASA